MKPLLSIKVALIAALAHQGAADYSLATSGMCEYKVPGAAECEVAATSLGYHASSLYDGSFIVNSTSWPSGCYYKPENNAENTCVGNVYFNIANGTACTAERNCICLQSSSVAPTASPVLSLQVSPSQLCLNADAYDPCAIAYTECKFWMSAASADAAFKSSFSCPAGCVSNCPDGSCDWETSTGYECYCNEIATTEAACSAIDHNGYSFTWSEPQCWQAESQWDYDDATDLCNREELWKRCQTASRAESCCSDGRSICEGYEEYSSPVCASGPSSELLAAARLWCSDPASAEAQHGHISTWDVSSEISLAGLFRGCESFNEDISGWDVSNVRDMQATFKGATSFNQDLSAWDVSNVLWIKKIFRGAESFDQCLEWNIESLKPNNEQISAFKGSSGGICGYCDDGEHCSFSFWASDGVCYACPFGKDACDGSTFCLNGANPMDPGCITCLNGSFMLNGTCRTCPEWAKYTYIVALLFAAFVCWLVYQNSGGDVDMSTLTISATHFQVTALYFTFALRYPKLVLDVLKWPFAIFAFDFVQVASPECSLEVKFDSYYRWVVNAAASLVVVLPLAFKYLVWDQVYDGDKNRTVSALALMVTLVYVFALTKAIEPFDCVKREDGSYQLANNPIIPCFNTNSLWLPQAAGGLLLFIIFVIFFNRFLYRSLIAVDEEGHREDTVKFANELFDKLDTDRSNDISINELSQAIRGDQELALEVRNKLGLPKEIEEDEIVEIFQEVDIDKNGCVDRSEFCVFFAAKSFQSWRKKIGFILVKYKPAWKYWELLTNLRKLLTVITQLLLSVSSDGQVVTMIVIVLFYMGAQVCCNDDGSFALPPAEVSILAWERRGPYRRESSNALEFRLLSLQLLQLLLAFIGTKTDMRSGILSAILLAIVGVGVLLVGAAIVAIVIVDPNNKKKLLMLKTKLTTKAIEEIGDWESPSASL